VKTEVFNSGAFFSTFKCSEKITITDSCIILEGKTYPTSFRWSFHFSFSTVITLSFNGSVSVWSFFLLADGYFPSGKSICGHCNPNLAFPEPVLMANVIIGRTII